MTTILHRTNWEADVSRLKELLMSNSTSNVATKQEIIVEQKTIGDQETVLNRVQGLDNAATNLVLNIIERAVDKVERAVEFSVAKIEAGVQIAVARQADAMMAEVLDDIQRQRDELEERRKTTRSPALKAHCDKQLAALDARETAIIDRLSRVLSEPPSSSSSDKALRSAEKTSEGLQKE